MPQIVNAERNLTPEERISNLLWRIGEQCDNLAVSIHQGHFKVHATLVDDCEKILLGIPDMIAWLQKEYTEPTVVKNWSARIVK